ncbi:MAG: hypothetical protein J6A66_05790 [Alistipes sp.]|nr:hypothetical protein [Alistipes sp.]
MKNFKIFFLSALVTIAGLFTACVEDSELAPGEFAEGPQVHFSSDAVTQFSLTADDTAVEIPVVRVETAGSLEVPVLAVVAEEDVELFTIPSVVVFADGEEESSIEVAFDRDSMEDGMSYSVTLTLDDPTMTTPYGSSSVVLNFAVPEPYVLLGKAIIWDGLVYTLFTGEVSEPYEVEVYEHLNYPGNLYFKNAYTKEYPTSFYVDFGMPEDMISTYVSYPDDDVYFVLNVTDPNCVILPLQSLGLNCSYGEMVAGMLSDAGAATVEDCAGTLKNGVITFPPKTLIIADDEGTYYGNSTGGFKIALPGAVLTDFSLEVEAAGHVADQGGNASPVVNVVAGADVAGVAVGFVAGDVTADYASVLAEVAAKKPNYTAVVDGACTVANAEPMEAGQVTAVVVPFDANGVAQTEDAVAITFYFAGCGAGELPACEIDAFLGWFSEVYGPGYEAQYPDATTMAMVIWGEDIVAAKYGFITGLQLEEDLEGEEAQAALDYVVSVIGKDPMVAIPAQYVADINGEGLGSYFDELPEGYPCTLFVEGENSYGQKKLIARGKDAYVAEAATPAQQAMMGMKMMQYSGIKAAKVPFANR